MPETSAGETVYASGDELGEYVQSSAESLDFSETQTVDGTDVTEWRRFLEKIQVKAKARIDEYCRRDFEDHPDDTLTESGEDGTSVIRLTGPVRQVHAVRVDGTVIDADGYHCEDARSLVRTAGSARDRYEHHDPQWPAGYGNIEIDLDWGYEAPPADIVQAEMELVDNVVASLVVKREGTVVQADNFEVEVSIPNAMTAEIRELLDEHREMGVFN